MIYVFYIVGDSGRFSRRANDRAHQRRLKGGERILKAYEANPSTVLEVVDETHRLFRITSETSPDVRYNVSCTTQFCDCPSRISTCKHILGVQLIIKGYFEALPNDLNPSVNVGAEFEPLQALQELQNEEVDNIPSSIGDHGKELREVICEMESMLTTMKTNIGELGEEEISLKVKVLKKCLTSLMEPFTFERPHSVSNMPTKGSIFPLQANVKRTRMGHRKTSKKRDMPEVGESSDPRPPSKRPAHTVISISKQKRMIFPKIPKVTCDICFTKTMVEKGDMVVCCRNCDKELTLEET